MLFLGTCKFQSMTLLSGPNSSSWNHSISRWVSSCAYFSSSSRSSLNCLCARFASISALADCYLSSSNSAHLYSLLLFLISLSALISALRCCLASCRSFRYFCLIWNSLSSLISSSLSWADSHSSLLRFLSSLLACFLTSEPNRSSL